jgi:cytoskeletal protein RodZ
MEPTALGRYLRESRESRELTLEQAVQALRIRPHILEAFERGEFDVADSPVRVRGMLRNYAQFLGLEEDRILQYYEASQQEPKRRKRSRKPEAEPRAPRRITDTPPALPAVKIQPQRNYQWGSALRNLLMGVFAVVAVAFVVYVIIQMMLRPEEPDPVALGLVATADGTITATYTPTWTPLPPTMTLPAGSGAVGISGIDVTVEITQRTWIRVEVDGTETFAGIREPGERSLYEGNSRVLLTIANAAGVDITFNGTSLPPYGARGQQVQLEFTAAGVNATGASIEPTATETPTDLPTIEVSATAAMVDGANAPIGSIGVPADGTALPTPTPLFTQAVQASPTPLFVQTDPVATVDPAQAVTATLAVFTATPEPPTATPTLSVVLPPRMTPANPTPTKTG